MGLEREFYIGNSKIFFKGFSKIISIGFLKVINDVFEILTRNRDFLPEYRNIQNLKMVSE